MKPFIKQSLTEYKSKVMSTFGSFLIIALITFIITISVLLATEGEHFFYNHELYDDLNSFNTNDLFRTLENTTTLYSVLSGIIFFIIYGIRNNYTNSLSTTPSRSSYMLSDLATGLTYSGFIALFGFMSDLLVRVISKNKANSFIYVNESVLSLARAASNFLVVFALCLTCFVSIMSFANAIARKKYALIPIYIAIPIVILLVVNLPIDFYPYFQSGDNYDGIAAYSNFLKSDLGIFVLSMLIAAITWTCNYLFISLERGFRR